MRKLLSEIYRIAERQYIRGDYGATVELVDLERAIERADLTERQRTALRLVYFEELTQDEAAQRMGHSQSAVSQFIRAAISKIAEQYRH